MLCEVGLGFLSFKFRFLDDLENFIKKSKMQRVIQKDSNGRPYFVPPPPPTEDNDKRKFNDKDRAQSYFVSQKKIPRENELFSS